MATGKPKGDKENGSAKTKSNSNDKDPKTISKTQKRRPPQMGESEPSIKGEVDKYRQKTNKGRY